MVPASVDLTAEGDVDWAIWGAEDEGATTVLASASRKDAGGGTPVAIIGDPSDINGLSIGDPLYNCGTCPAFDDQIEFSWSDGTPVASGSMETAALLFRRQGVGGGFTLSVPASPVEQTLKVYASAFHATASLVATLSDGGMDTTFMDSSVTHPSGFVDQLAVYTFNFSGINPGASLDIELTVSEDLGNFENVGLLAATLSTTIPEPATAMLALIGCGAFLPRRR